MKFLFLCTGNSCRSILSEVLFNSRAPEGWKAYSAGSKPSGQVHPLTIETLENLGLKSGMVHLRRKLDMWMTTRNYQNVQNYRLFVKLQNMHIMELVR